MGCCRITFRKARVQAFGITTKEGASMSVMAVRDCSELWSLNSGLWIFPTESNVISTNRVAKSWLAARAGRLSRCLICWVSGCSSDRHSTKQIICRVDLFRIVSHLLLISGFAFSHDLRKSCDTRTDMTHGLFCLHTSQPESVLSMMFASYGSSDTTVLFDHSSSDFSIACTMPPKSAQPCNSSVWLMSYGYYT